MDGRCQCGAIKFTTPTAQPRMLYICHCTECRHQSSSAFGLTAIFPSFTIDPPRPGALGVYSRTTLSGRQLDCYFCTRCGSRLMHKAEGEATLGVKGGCLEGKVDWNAGIHIWCKEAVVDIPAGVERYDEKPLGGSLDATRS